MLLVSYLLSISIGLFCYFLVTLIIEMPTFDFQSIFYVERLAIQIQECKEIRASERV